MQYTSHPVSINAFYISSFQQYVEEAAHEAFVKIKCTVCKSRKEVTGVCS